MVRDNFFRKRSRGSNKASVTGANDMHDSVLDQMHEEKRKVYICLKDHLEKKEKARQELYIDAAKQWCYEEGFTQVQVTDIVLNQGTDTFYGNYELKVNADGLLLLFIIPHYAHHYSRVRGAKVYTRDRKYRVSGAKDIVRLIEEGKL